MIEKIIARIGMRIRKGFYLTDWLMICAVIGALGLILIAVYVSVYL